MTRDSLDSPLSRFVYVVLVPLIALGLAVAIPVAIPGSPWHEKPKLGLDLQGGVEIVLKAVTPTGRPASLGEVDRSLTIIRDRIDKLGVAEHDVRKQGRDEIVVELAGVRDPAAAARLVGRTAQLEFYDVGPDLLGGPAPTRTALLGRFGGHRAPPRTVVLTCTASHGCPRARAGANGTLYYLFRRDPARGIPEMTGPDFKPSSVDFDPEAAGRLTVDLTREGERAFQRLTERQARRGRAAGAIQYSAIVLDREIETLAGVDYREPSGPTTGGRIGITGRPDVIANVAFLLQTGSLPVSFRQIERTEVSATLGRDSLREAKRAALGGLLLVAIFLLVLYRGLGLVAVVGLGIYGVFLYSAILRLDVTLTLPSFAGVILTIGLAADANVVIFERIKEELRRGRPVRTAIGIGYTRGFRTIVDAHVVTAITAVLLFLVAAARVRGFAVMLLFGTVLSLFTAVAATRALLALLSGFAWFADAKLLGVRGPQRLRFLELDFIRRRYVWFAVSGALLAAGGASLGVHGLDLGIDFKGGSQLAFTTPRAHSTADVRAALGTVGRTDAVVQGLGARSDGAYTRWQVRTEALAPRAEAQLRHALRERLDAGAFGSTTVSATFGRQLAWRALWAVVAALVLIVLYVGWRFELAFAVPVIVALVHDVALTVGVYSLTRREVNTSTVAAVLTVLGYSIYDTIIIFDRIRENVRVLRRPSLAAIANLSLRQTIRRSLTTTFVTLLPVGSLLAFGGATLHDFAFAILVGILAGAYSSIFIATPLLVMLKRGAAAAGEPAAEPA